MASWPDQEREGPGAVYARRFLGAGHPPISRVDSRNPVPADVSLHHLGFRVGKTLTLESLLLGGAHQLRLVKCISF
jgi:hypothetical protein